MPDLYLIGPPCACGDSEAEHVIGVKAGRKVRKKCSRGSCGCREYRPEQPEHTFESGDWTVMPGGVAVRILETDPGGEVVRYVDPETGVEMWTHVARLLAAGWIPPEGKEGT